MNLYFQIIKSEWVFILKFFLFVKKKQNNFNCNSKKKIKNKKVTDNRNSSHSILNSNSNYSIKYNYLHKKYLPMNIGNNKF
jgi:hypothetical protein